MFGFPSCLELKTLISLKEIYLKGFEVKEIIFTCSFSLLLFTNSTKFVLSSPFPISNSLALRNFINFAKAFNIKYLTDQSNEAFCWTTSWGVSTRLMGGLIMIGTYFIINIFSEELASKFESITNLGGRIKNLIIPNGIIIKASIKVLITKIDKERMPTKVLFKLIITSVRVMVFLINNQLALRIYSYDIRYFQKSVLLLWLFSCKGQYRIHQ